MMCFHGASQEYRGQAYESGSDWGPEEEDDPSDDTQEEEGSSEDEARSGRGAAEAEWETVPSYNPYVESMQDGLGDDDEEEEEEEEQDAAVGGSGGQEPIGSAAALKVRVGNKLRACTP